MIYLRKRPEHLLKEMGAKLKLEIIPADSPDQILAESDIICTASSSATPLFDGSQVRPGTHINGIGSLILPLANWIRQLSGDPKWWRIRMRPA